MTAVVFMRSRLLRAYGCATVYAGSPTRVSRAAGTVLLLYWRTFILLRKLYTAYHSLLAVPHTTGVLCLPHALRSVGISTGLPDAPRTHTFVLYGRFWFSRFYLPVAVTIFNAPAVLASATSPLPPFYLPVRNKLCGRRTGAFVTPSRRHLARNL